MSAKEMMQKEQRAPERVETARQEPVFLPEVDILEGESGFRLFADMPGVDEKSIEIDVDKNVLTVRGQFVPKPPEGFNLTYQEYSSGNYERSFTLGNTIDRENIKAMVRDGVLRLDLPKAREAQPRRIEVKAG